MSAGIIVKVNGSPDAELALAGRIEVYEQMGETTLYNIQYDEDIKDGDLPGIIDGRLDPGSVISVLAGLADQLQCLVKGPVSGQQIHLEHGGEGSSLELHGADSSIIMDREFKSVQWANVTDGEAVTQIVSSYGLLPDVTTTSTRHLETKHSLVQRETDYRFIKRLARRNGCYFWISCDELGIETAHFQRPMLTGTAVRDLVINSDGNNIKSLDIHWDAERPTSVDGLQLDLTSKSDMNGDVQKSPLTSLGTKDLSDITNDTRSMHLSWPTDDAGDINARGEGSLIEAGWFIRATCTTSFDALAGLVRANTVVNVKGAGSRHSGKYYVAAVKHIIDATAHVMELELVRNAWNESAGGALDTLSKIF